MNTNSGARGAARGVRRKNASRSGGDSGGCGARGRGNGGNKPYFQGRWWYAQKGRRGREIAGRASNKEVTGDASTNDCSINDPNNELVPNGSSRGSRKSANDNSRCRRRSHSDSDIDGNQPKVNSLVRAQWKKKFPGYHLYFPSPSHPYPEDTDKKIEAVTDHLLRSVFRVQKNIEQVEEKECFDANLNEILRDENFKESWPTCCSDLEDSPRDVLNIWGLAIHKVVFETKSQLELAKAPAVVDDDGNYILPPKVSVPYIRVGLMKFDPIIPLKSIKASFQGKLITVRGAIVRSGIARLFCIRQTFRCRKCQAITVIDQPEGQYTMPQQCSGEGCAKGEFEPLPNAPTTKVIEYRRIRIQDVEHSHLEHGRIPRTIDCDLFYDLVNQGSAGDVVTLCGIVKVAQDNAGHGADPNLHNLFIEVVAIRNHKDSERTMGGHAFSFSNKDYYAVKEIFESDRLFRLLVASLCPGIFGMEQVKAGLLLALFGGTVQDKIPIPRRPDINILIVGDPGLGKSQLLKIISEVAPRGIYVCGTGSTAAGLTVTLVKEGEECSLEAGALVMADKGVCCIDEFDKMLSHHSALLEAMEQQSVSIAKAGVFRTIPARTTVLAAANPVAGHYDKTKTVPENIRISAPLLSRFDLIFILQDRPNHKQDRSIMEHIAGFRVSARDDAVSCSVEAGVSATSFQSFSESLKFDRGESVDLIPHLLMRKYIAYAKQYVHPKMSPEAATLIKEYYLDLRKNHRHLDSTPVTTRQLESLVRLAEARAKAELRELVREEDAKEVLELFDYSMKGVYDNDHEITLGFTQDILDGSFHSPNISASASRSLGRNMAKRLASVMQRRVEQSQKNVFSVDEIKELAATLGVNSGVTRLIDVLNNDGFLIKKGASVYQFMCAD